MTDITIRERVPGSWAIRIRRPKQLPHYFTVRGTRADAEAAAQSFDRKEPLRALDPKTTTLGEWIEYLLNNARDLSPRSLTTYRNLLRNCVNCERQRHLKPHDRHWPIGRVRLRDMTEEHAGIFAARTMDTKGRQGPISGITVRAAMKLVRASLAQAVAKGMLLTNPWETAVLPRLARRPETPPGRAELATLTDVEPPRVRLLLLLAAYTGARRSELLALRWRDIDMRRQTMTIAASLDQRAGEPPTLKDTKTRAGLRTIELPGMCVALLREARAQSTLANWQRHKQRLLDTGDATIAPTPLTDVPVFANDNGTWWSPQAASQAAKRALEAAGLPGSLHTLRHAHATLLLGEGKISPHVVSRRLGHASIAQTLSIYAHVIPADDKVAADAIDRVFATAGAKRGVS